MTDAIVVLNAGSSSLKFSVFAGADDLPFVVGGQVSGLYTAAPRFIAKDDSGSAIAEKRWDAEAALDHEGAIGHIVEWLRVHLRARTPPRRGRPPRRPRGHGLRRAGAGRRARS